MQRKHSRKHKRKHKGAYFTVKTASMQAQALNLLIPKIVYTSSLLPTPEHIVKELNQLLYKVLWKGKDKVTRASAINNYEDGGIKMIDIESLIKSLRLS